MLPLLKDCKICSAKCRVFMVTVQDSLISAGAQSSDLKAILEALENDSIGHSREEEASGPFTELNPAVLGQSPLRLNVKRCNIVKMAIRGAKGGHVNCARDQCHWFHCCTFLKICTCISLWCRQQKWLSDIVCCTGAAVDAFTAISASL